MMIGYNGFYGAAAAAAAAALDDWGAVAIAEDGAGTRGKRLPCCSLFKFVAHTCARVYLTFWNIAIDLLAKRLQTDLVCESDFVQSAQTFGRSDVRSFVQPVRWGEVRWRGRGGGAVRVVVAIRLFWFPWQMLLLFLFTSLHLSVSLSLSRSLSQWLVFSLLFAVCCFGCSYCLFYN